MVCCCSFIFLIFFCSSSDTTPRQPQYLFVADTSMDACIILFVCMLHLEFQYARVCMSTRVGCVCLSVCLSVCLFFSPEWHVALLEAQSFIAWRYISQTHMICLLLHLIYLVFNMACSACAVSAAYMNKYSILNSV